MNDQDSKKVNSRVYIVSGMHRLATSFLSHCLNNTGVNMGENFSKSDNNPEGYFENPEFVILNEKILKEAGGTWFNPPSREAIKQVIPQFKDEFIELVNKNRDVLWGWKDPRNCLTLEYLLPYLEDEKYLVCIFRKPEGIINSLTTKYDIDDKKMTTEMATNIIKTYNKRLIRLIKKFLGMYG